MSKSRYLTDSLISILERSPKDTVEKIQNEIIAHEDYFLETIKVNGKINFAGHILEQTDKILGDWYNAKPEITNRIACSKGCAYCCNIAVCVSDSEALWIAENLKLNNMAVDIEKIKRQALASDDRDWLEQSDEDAICVFVKDGQCSIYPIRPLMCRKFFAMDTNKLCKPKDGKSLRAVNTHLEIIMSALMNSDECGSLPKMLLKYENLLIPASTDQLPGSVP